MKKYLALSFVYIQGLSLFNPIYFIFLYLLSKRIFGKIFLKRQLFFFIGLVYIQFIAITLNPHSLPMSYLASLLGLFAFTVQPEKIFKYSSYKIFINSTRKIVILVLFIYFLDSLQRLLYINLNFTGFTDYVFKENIKGATYLADDTNTLALRIIFLFYISSAIGLVNNFPIFARLFFSILMLSTYSRAGEIVLILVFLSQINIIRVVLLRYAYLFLSLFVLIIVIYSSTLIDIIISSDSSVISKFVLFYASYEYWLSSDLLIQIIGLGYFSDIDVGTFSGLSWASGHSFIYYLLVEFGIAGSLLLIALLHGQATSRESKFLLLFYFIIGLSLFRFDFLFLYVTLFYTNNKLFVNGTNKVI